MYTCVRCGGTFFREMVFLVLCTFCMKELQQRFPITRSHVSNFEIQAFLNELKTKA